MSSLPPGNGQCCCVLPADEQTLTLLVERTQHCSDVVARQRLLGKGLASALICICAPI